MDIVDLFACVAFVFGCALFLAFVLFAFASDDLDGA